MNEFLIHKKLVTSESTAFKCFLHCLFSKYGWMDDEGGFLLHDIKITLEQADVEIDRLEFILYRCTAIESVDKCERAYLFTHCFWGKIAEVSRDIVKKYSTKIIFFVDNNIQGEESSKKDYCTLINIIGDNHLYPLKNRY